MKCCNKELKFVNEKATCKVCGAPWCCDKIMDEDFNINDSDCDFLVCETCNRSWTKGKGFGKTRSFRDNQKTKQSDNINNEKHDNQKTKQSDNMTDIMIDNRISLKARGFFMIMQYFNSSTDTWGELKEKVMLNSGEGRTSFDRAVKELQEYGYLEITRPVGKVWSYKLNPHGNL